MSESQRKEPERRTFVIHVKKESLHFSAGHFTIFSATERENLHGHNFQVQAEFEAEIGDDGLVFDYSIVKDLLQVHCDQLDEKTLLPERSPHLQVGESNGYIKAEFNGELMPFLLRDVLTLPIRNVTVEELSNWFIDQIRANEDFQALPVAKLTIRIASGSGQWGVATLENP